MAAGSASDLTRGLRNEPVGDDDAPAGLGKGLLGDVETSRLGSRPERARRTGALGGAGGLPAGYHRRGVTEGI